MGSCIDDFLQRQRDVIIQEWVNKLEEMYHYSRPRTELFQTCTDAFEANYQVIVWDDYEPIDRFIQQITRMRLEAGFLLSDVQKAFELYRIIVIPLLAQETTTQEFCTNVTKINWYSGRADDAFKSRGEWVMPVEVENVIMKHVSVLESAVIGFKDEDGLEKPMAFVVLLSASDASEDLEDEIKEHIRTELPGYKVPARIRFIHELPKTATGKYQRFKLRQVMREEIASMTL